MSPELQLLYAASNEIKGLRSQVLQTKADAYDRIATLIGFLPRMSQGMGEDVAWRIDRRIAELENPPADESNEIPF